MSIWQAFLFALDDADPVTLLVLFGGAWMMLIVLLGGMGSLFGQWLGHLWVQRPLVIRNLKQRWSEWRSDDTEPDFPRKRKAWR